MKQIMLVGLLLAVPSLAALPPYWDRVEQIKVAVSAPDLDEKLRVIASVRHVEDLKYEVTGMNGCRALVQLKAAISNPVRPGPTQYRVRSKHIDCR